MPFCCRSLPHHRCLGVSSTACFPAASLLSHASSVWRKLNCSHSISDLLSSTVICFILYMHFTKANRERWVTWTEIKKCNEVERGFFPSKLNLRGPGWVVHRKTRKNKKKQADDVKMILFFPRLFSLHHDFGLGLSLQPAETYVCLL